LLFRATVATMSDFDAVLERLVTDQSFAAALAPQRLPVTSLPPTR